MSLISPYFLLLFLPAALIGHRLLARKWAVLWLLACSIAFYAWSGPLAACAMVLWIWTNHRLAQRIAGGGGTARWLTWAACAANTAVLCAMKGGSWTAALGISYLTFQQIAYLVDVYRGETKPGGFADYCTWILFFPKVIAGPILRHDEALPELQRREAGAGDISGGLTFLVLGLAKKTLLADQLAAISHTMLAAGDPRPDFFAAWLSMILFGAKLYFDFSGYSDMAVGIGMMFGLRLPFNFNSPYKAASVVEFWRRWHITLSRFLTDYLYFALPGTRRSRAMRYVNLLPTMALCGLWHGFGVNFLVWGALHGAFLIVNHAWREVARRAGWKRPVRRWWSVLPARALTMLSVVGAWSFFATSSSAQALALVRGMAGLNGLLVGPSLTPRPFIKTFLAHFGFTFGSWSKSTDLVLTGVTYPVICLVALAVIVAMTGPNVQELRRRNSLGWGVVLGVLVFFVLKAYFEVAPGPFLYGGF